MIKKVLLGLGLLILGFINFSNSGYIRQIGTLAYSPYDNNLDVVTLNKGSFLTNKLGVGKDVFYYQDSSDRSIYIFWGNLNGTITPYYMFKSSIFNEQGFFTKYAICDELTGESLNAVFPGNCSITDYNSSSIPLIKNHLSTVNSEDFYYFSFSSFSSSYSIDMCISSSEIGKSICFSSCNVTNKDYYSCTSFGTYYLPSGNYGEYRTGSLNISPGFDNLPINLLYSSPAVDGSINGGSNTSDNVLLTGNLIYNKCTNGYVISQIDSLYGNSYRNSCFAGGYDTGLIDQYSSGFVYQVGYGMDFKQLYNLTKNGQSWDNWFNSNLDSMQRYKLGKFGNTNPFMGNPVVLYTYFNILYDRLGILPNDPVTSSYDVLNYCQLLLYSNIDEEYKGSYFKSYCDSLNYNNGGGIINTGEIGDIDDVEILPPGFDGGNDGSVTSSGTVVSVDWSGILSGSTNENFDGKNFINNFYQKLQSVFQKPIGNAVGIIPSYILVFMFALILFRFLSH